jgi:hypothetical protein
MSLRAVVERLEQLDPACLDAGGVAAGFRELERLKGFVAETEHALARRANVLAAAGSGAPAGDLIERAGHCSPREAQRTSRRAEVLGSLPSMSAQLGKGRIGAEHADAVASVVGRLDEADQSTLLSLDDELARTAAASTPARFRRFVGRLADQLVADRGVERAVRQRAAMTLSKGINDDTGMYWLRGEFDPETGARLFRAIDAEVAALTKQQGPDDHTDRGQLAARALVELATAANRSKRPGRVELLALVDLDTLTTGRRDNSVCELHDGTEIPVATLRRLACDAHIIPVVLDGDGMPLDVGAQSTTRHRRPTPSVAHHVPHLRHRGLRRPVRSLRHPPPRRMGRPPRPHQPRSAHPRLQPSPSPRPRRRLAPRTGTHHPRAHRHTPRRHHPPTKSTPPRDGTDRQARSLMVHVPATPPPTRASWRRSRTGG